MSQRLLTVALDQREAAHAVARRRRGMRGPALARALRALNRTIAAHLFYAPPSAPRAIVRASQEAA